MINNVKYLNTKTNRHHPTVVRVYKQIRKEFGMVVDPFSLHSISPNILTEVWAACRETELVGKVSRAEKEIVAACVSASNQCSYCVDAHTMLLNAVGEIGVSNFISRGDYEQINDEHLSSLINWARSTKLPTSDIILNPPFSKISASEYIGMAVFYHYLNRMVHVFLPDQLLPVKSNTVKKSLKRMAGCFFSFSVKRAKKQGDALTLLPNSELPDDMSWALGSETISQSFSQMASVIETQEKSIVPAQVRTIFNDFIAQWDGQSYGINSGWMIDLLKGLNPENAIILKLALLTAIEPYKVNELIIGEFKNFYEDESSLLSVVCWASFTVSRRVGQWCYQTFEK
ncbi:hypothetical protein MNBD_GAMMA12-277 [hydrothermal vent metagenome]|uniref:Carboxymuconolactone decarboxylase-like domain-containing protein n=1 Tax=hydrothermal vent metagenome TaxID=652676 RepID=A0A3B0YEM8_9ZZZZ